MMPTISLETAILLIRTAFLLGAITDGLAIFPMLSRRIGVMLFGGDLSRNNPAFRYAMGIASSLMAGWTLLLLWAASSPIERRDILLLTIFPVVTGIVLATIVAVRHRIVLLSRVIPLWVHLGFVSIFYVTVYILSTPFSK